MDDPQQPADFEYTPPLEPEEDESVAEADPVELADLSEEPQAPLVTVRRRRPTLRLNLVPLVFAALLVLFAAVLLAGGQLVIPIEVALWWPLAGVLFAVLWLLAALVRGHPRGVIGGAGLLGFAVSVLLGTAYQVPPATTLAGITFIALGAGVLLRALFLRPTPIRT